MASGVMPGAGLEGEGNLDELNGRMIACQILLTGLIARVANDQRDPIGFLSDFRDEIHAFVSQVRISGTTGDQPRPPNGAQDGRRIIFADEAAEQ